MKKLFFSILFTISVIAVNAGNPGNGVPIKVKPSESAIAWTAYKVTGKHHGLVAIKEGSLDIQDGLLTGGSFVIDMTSISVSDLQGNGKAKLESHLKSDDFFGVEQFPTATLVITEAKSNGDGNYDIKANLTIKGITNPIAFNAIINQGGNTFKASADITVDRTLYNVRYGSGKFFENLGDATISDEFVLNVSLVAGE
ncbi:MAG TPA: YceI family protein [Saprospiraceae bacterium]|nr:YceI family protein [Saprospiraceae bacterium]